MQPCPEVDFAAECGPLKKGHTLNRGENPATFRSHNQDAEMRQLSAKTS